MLQQTGLGVPAPQQAVPPVQQVEPFVEDVQTDAVRQHDPLMQVPVQQVPVVASPQHC